MTTEELRNKILSAKAPDWFNTITFRFYNNSLGFNLTLTGVTAIYEYLKQQSEGWAGINTPLHQRLQVAKNGITNLKNTVETFVTNSINYDTNILANQWQNQIASIHNGEYIPYDSPEVQFLIVLNQRAPTYFPSAYDFLITKYDLHSQTNKPDYLAGVLLAYEFKTRELSELISRKSSEAATVTDTRRNFEQYLSSTEKQILDLLKNVQDQKKEDSIILQDLWSEKTKKLDDLHNSSAGNIENFLEGSKTKMAELEQTYQELLRLKEPAEYWNQRAIKLKLEGRITLGILIALIVVGAVALYFLLWKTPDGLLKSFFNDDKSIALRWSIVFITFITLIFIGVRMVSKVMFSSFHLARDAEERQQLTYVYLALRKDASVDDKDKQLIMQSLFSRADTGLLKEDSSPTMPGGLDKIIKP